MKLGTFMMPLHPPTRHAWETLREDREAIILADRLGYAEAFVGEHSTDLAENVTSCLMFLCSLAFETLQIKLGSGTLNTQHPSAAVAANVAMIDHLLQGRSSWHQPRRPDVRRRGLRQLRQDRLEMFVEAIDMVLAIWAGDAPYDLRGKHFEVSTARTMIREIGQGIILKPFQAPHPPIVVTAVAPFSRGVAAAAARGWEPISGNFLLPEWVRTHWPSYVEGCAQAGRPADPANWRVAKSIFVTETDALAGALCPRPRALTSISSS
jgi:alkanesulfonate monooxygenase SsuD/methylene tetrahydromethanopterin reductase-like flavin-dependent oxidoreductase (luciferase family)